MEFKNIHFIVNPAAGKEEAILSYINRVFDGTGIHWQVTVTQRDMDLQETARQIAGTADIIAVYGGDGSVTEVASALHGTGKPIAIIPGGTANVMAKELGIPVNSVSALELLRDGYDVASVDMAQVGERRFLMRVNLGIMAEMVLMTDRESKSNLGQLAYGINAFRAIADNDVQTYRMTIDGGEEVAVKGVSLTVTNVGNSGIGSLALHPDVVCDDGYLDILLLENADVFSLLKVAGSTIFQADTDAVKHWRCRQVNIELEREQHYLCDDCELTGQRLDISVLPGAMQLIVPKTDMDTDD